MTSEVCRAAADAPACPVCLARATRPFATVQRRDYWRCAVCRATFLEPAQRPDAAAEAAYYRLHDNDPLDPRYRRFLARLAERLLARLPAAAAGLDYGCGPGLAVAGVPRCDGIRVNLGDACRDSSAGDDNGRRRRNVAAPQIGRCR